MLVLSRKKSEEIVIDDRISIMVVEIRGDKVRLGIDAPAEIKIHRKEIWLEIQKESGNEQCSNAEVPRTGCV
jgi:carbon storage regulator